MTPRDLLLPLVLGSAFAGACEQTRDPGPVTVEQTPSKDPPAEDGTPQPPHEARAEVQTFLGETFNMADARREGLAIRVLEEWAVAKDDSGLMFLCKRQGGTWTLLASGTKLKAPSEAPLGLVPSSP